MHKSVMQLRVDGLTALQLAELKAAVAAASDCLTTVESPKLTGGRVGEPMLLSAVIALAPSVISAVALWLAKSKEKHRAKLKYTKIDAKGNMESFDIEQWSYQEGESATTALQALLTRVGGNDKSTAS